MLIAATQAESLSPRSILALVPHLEFVQAFLQSLNLELTQFKRDYDVAPGSTAVDDIGVSSEQLRAKPSESVELDMRKHYILGVFRTAANDVDI